MKETLHQISIYLDANPHFYKNVKLISIYVSTAVGGFSLSDIDAQLAVGLKITAYITFFFFVIINMERMVNGLKYTINLFKFKKNNDKKDTGADGSI